MSSITTPESAAASSTMDESLVQRIVAAASALAAEVTIHRSGTSASDPQVVTQNALGRILDVYVTELRGGASAGPRGTFVDASAELARTVLREYKENPADPHDAETVITSTLKSTLRVFKQHLEGGQTAPSPKPANR